MNGYCSFQSPAMPSSAGRSRGGLLTLLSNTLTLKVKKILNTSSYYHIILCEPYKDKSWILINFYNNNFGTNQAEILIPLEKEIATLENI